MGFSDGRFSIWTGKGAKGSTPLEFSHPSQLRRVRQWRLHREKRFRRPPEALGHAFEYYDVIMPEARIGPAPVREPALESTEPEVGPALTHEIEKIQRTSLNGFQICAITLFFIFAALTFPTVLVLFFLILLLLYVILPRT